MKSSNTNVLVKYFSYDKLIRNKNKYLACALVIAPIAVVIIYSIHIATFYITGSDRPFNFLLFFSSIITFTGLWLTAYSLLANSIETKRKSSMDILFSLEKDLEFLEAKSELMNKKQNLYLMFEKIEKGHDSRYEEAKTLKKSFIYCMNIYEFISLSIRKGIIDEQLFTALYKSRFLKIWKIAEPLILELRKKEGKQTLYEHTQWLAEKYDK